MPDDEQSLAEAPTESVDLTPELDVDDFDLEGFLSGFRPTRRAVRVYPRADLVATMEELGARFDGAKSAAERKRIAAEVFKLKKTFDETARWFIVEGRSSEWVTRYRSMIAQKLGLDLGTEDDDGTAEQREARLEVTLHQVAEQVVIPSGMTHKAMRQMYDASETEVNKIITAVAMANGQQVESSRIVTRDFSPGSSVGRKTGGSSKR